MSVRCSRTSCSILQALLVTAALCAVFVLGIRITFLEQEAQRTQNQTLQDDATQLHFVCVFICLALFFCRRVVEQFEESCGCCERKMKEAEHAEEEEEVSTEYAEMSTLKLVARKEHH